MVKKLGALYIAVDPLFVLVVKGLTAIYQGIWLGVLNRSALQEIASTYYAHKEAYQSDSYNMRGLWDWEANAIDQYFVGCQSVLLGAAGGGREIVGLARRGLKVAAFECQPSLVAYSQQLLQSQAIQAQVMLAQPDQVPESSAIYDGLILGWGAYIHITGRDNRIQFLTQFRQHVKTGGPLLLSFWVRPRDGKQMRWTFKVARFLRRIRGSKEPIEMGDTLNGTFDHYSTEDEIRAELAAAGFELVFFADSPYGHAVGRAI